MERNDTFDTFDTPTSGAASGAAATPDTSFSRDTGAESSGFADRARGAAGTASDKLGDMKSTVKDRASNLKSTLADALESGAERLRQQGSGSGQFTGASVSDGSAGVLAETPQLGQAANQLAGGMQASADWLRDADLDGLKVGLERQVKDHPGRTLAVALGVGYLLGKAFRR